MQDCARRGCFGYAVRVPLAHNQHVKASHKIPGRVALVRALVHRGCPTGYAAGRYLVIGTRSRYAIQLIAEADKPLDTVV
jgi:hypothetical protein